MKEKFRPDGWNKIEKQKSKMKSLKCDQKMMEKVDKAKLSFGAKKRRRFEEEKLKYDFILKKDLMRKIKVEESLSVDSDKKKKKRFEAENFNRDLKKKEHKVKFDLQRTKKLEEGSPCHNSEKRKTQNKKMKLNYKEKKEKLELNFKERERSEYCSNISNGSSFFRNMLEDFEEFMFIPPSFADEIGGLLKQTVYLKHFDDQYWEAILDLKQGCLAFLGGWNEFILNHSITEGELLLFTYEGDSVFTVRIFGIDCRERMHNYKSKKRMNSKRKESETQSEDSCSHKKQMYDESSSDEIEFNMFDSTKKKMSKPSTGKTKSYEDYKYISKNKILKKNEKAVEKKVQKSIKRMGKNDVTLPDSRCKGKIHSVEDDTAIDGRNDTKYVDEKKTMKKSRKENACSSKLFNESMEGKIIGNKKKKVLGKISKKHTETSEDQLIPKGKENLRKNTRISKKSKLNPDENKAYQDTSPFATPICPLPINAYMPWDEYSCTSYNEKTTKLTDLCCDFFVDEDGVCHLNDECQMNDVNGNMFHSSNDIKHNVRTKDQVHHSSNGEREDIRNQNCNNLSKEKHRDAEVVKHMAITSTKKSSLDEKHKKKDGGNITSLVPGNFKFSLAIPSRNNWALLPEKLPVPRLLNLERRVILLCNPLGQLWPVLYI